MVLTLLLLHLKLSQWSSVTILVGCDFAGSASGRRLRAESAEPYKRNLRIPIQGACGKTVFSDSRLIISRDIIQKIDSCLILKY